MVLEWQQSLHCVFYFSKLIDRFVSYFLYLSHSLNVSAAQWTHNFNLKVFLSCSVLLWYYLNTLLNSLWVSSSGRPAGPPAWGDRLASAGQTLNKAWWWRLKSNRILKRENIKLLIQRFRSLIYHQIYKIQEFTHKNMFIISTHQIESSPWQQRPSDCSIRVCMCVFPLLPRDYYCNQ